MSARGVLLPVHVGHPAANSEGQPGRVEDLSKRAHATETGAGQEWTSANGCGQGGAEDDADCIAGECGRSHTARGAGLYGQQGRHARGEAGAARAAGHHWYVCASGVHNGAIAGQAGALPDVSQVRHTDDRGQRALNAHLHRLCARIPQCHRNGQTDLHHRANVASGAELFDTQKPGRLQVLSECYTDNTLAAHRLGQMQIPAARAARHGAICRNVSHSSRRLCQHPHEYRAQPPLAIIPWCYHHANASHRERETLLIPRCPASY